jgi:hypothetical protein
LDCDGSNAELLLREKLGWAMDGLFVCLVG